MGLMGAGTRCGPKGPSIVERVRGRHPTVASRGSSRESTLMAARAGTSALVHKTAPTCSAGEEGVSAVHARAPTSAGAARGASHRSGRRHPGRRAPLWASSAGRLPPAQAGEGGVSAVHARAPTSAGAARGASHRSGRRHPGCPAPLRASSTGRLPPARAGGRSKPVQASSYPSPSSRAPAGLTFDHGGHTPVLPPSTPEGSGAEPLRASL